MGYKITYQSGITITCDKDWNMDIMPFIQEYESNGVIGDLPYEYKVYKTCDFMLNKYIVAFQLGTPISSSCCSMDLEEWNKLTDIEMVCKEKEADLLKEASEIIQKTNDKYLKT